MLTRHPQHDAGKNPFFSGTAHADGTPAVIPHRWDGVTSSMNARARARLDAVNGPPSPRSMRRRTRLRSTAEVDVSPHGLVSVVAPRPRRRSNAVMAAVPPSEDHSALAEGSSEVRIIGPISATSRAVRARPASWARRIVAPMIAALSTLAVVRRSSPR